MILDFLTTCASHIKISDYTNLSSNMIASNSMSYTIKTVSDIKSWNLNTNYVPTMNFTILSPTCKILKEIDYELVTGSGNTTVKIETSLDYINWNELEYIEAKKLDDFTNDKYVYKVLKNGNETKYFNVYTNEFNDIDVINAKYIFKKYNKFTSNYDYIYPKLEFKFIRITLENIPMDELIPSSIFFTKLSILIEEDFSSIINNILEMKAGMFTQSKIFDEYPMFPDYISNFMKMLEEDTITDYSLNYTKASSNENLIDVIIANSNVYGIGVSEIPTLIF